MATLEELARGRARGLSALRAHSAAQKKAPRPPCRWCEVSLEGRKANALWCSTRCRTYWMRRARRRAAILQQPNCLICGKRMPYKTTWRGPGVNLTARSCGEMCKRKLHAWFPGGRARKGPAPWPKRGRMAA